MEYRYLGNSGFKVPALGLAVALWSVRLDRRQLRRPVALACAETAL